jgi:hypothetical protein
VSESEQPGLALLLREAAHAAGHQREQVTRYLQEHVRVYEGMLALGAYQHLLPWSLRQRAVVEQFDVPRFVENLENMALRRSPEHMVDGLRLLC